MSGERENHIVRRLMASPPVAPEPAPAKLNAGAPPAMLAANAP